MSEPDVKVEADVASDPVIMALKEVSNLSAQGDRILLSLSKQLVERVVELEARLTKVETELAYAANRKE